MHNLKLEVGHLCRQLRRRMHVRENRTPLPSQSSSSEGEQSYRWRIRSLLSEFLAIPSHSEDKDRHHYSRVRTPPTRILEMAP